MCSNKGGVAFLLRQGDFKSHSNGHTIGQSVFVKCGCVLLFEEAKVAEMSLRFAPTESEEDPLG